MWSASWTCACGSDLTVKVPWPLDSSGFNCFSTRPERPLMGRVIDSLCCGFWEVTGSLGERLIHFSNEAANSEGVIVGCACAGPV